MFVYYVVDHCIYSMCVYYVVITVFIVCLFIMFVYYVVDHCIYSMRLDLVHGLEATYVPYTVRPSSSTRQTG